MTSTAISTEFRRKLKYADAIGSIQLTVKKTGFRFTDFCTLARYNSGIQKRLKRNPLEISEVQFSYTSVGFGDLIAQKCANPLLAQ